MALPAKKRKDFLTCSFVANMFLASFVLFEDGSFHAMYA